ncbi:MAG: Gfo/Idh/MocA family oxidoreductase [Bacteroidales bacterium]|nr:Gfo/Idh/MocA family oxidoreductase [Bacteroidales bacterium]
MTDRRTFIKEMGAMAGLLALAPWLKSCSSSEAAYAGEKARVALIGCGSRGQYHLVLLQSMAEAEVVALCDDYQPNLQAASAFFPKARLYSDYRKLLEDPQIDGVIIATPLGLHARMTLDALDAGKHVFCEKAMALTLEQCREVYEASRRTSKSLYYCMQRMFDEKYIRGVQLIREGLIGEVVGMRCHWFRNADWRREVPSPELERRINWRLYKEYSAGLMTELACHQLEVCNWTLDRMPSEIIGLGDIVYWKDAREVYDSINVTYRYSNGCKITYESLISNKYNGMEDQILGKKGTMDLTRGVYYLEEDHLVSGMRQLLDQIRDGIFAAVPAAGPSWRPEIRAAYVPHPVIEGSVSVNAGQSMVAADNDGSDLVLKAFCRSCISGEKPENIVEEAYCATLLCLLGNQAMEEQRLIRFPEEYKIPYMKF